MLEKSKEELRQQIDAAIARLETEATTSRDGANQTDAELAEQTRLRRALED